MREIVPLIKQYHLNLSQLR